MLIATKVEISVVTLSNSLLNHLHTYYLLLRIHVRIRMCTRVTVYARTRVGEKQQVSAAKYSENIEQCFVVTRIMITFTEENIKQP